MSKDEALVLFGDIYTWYSAHRHIYIEFDLHVLIIRGAGLHSRDEWTIKIFSQVIRSPDDWNKLKVQL